MKFSEINEICNMLRQRSTKLKGQLSLELINEARRHEDVWGSGGIVPPLLASELDARVWSASRP
jgi:hypothetical protein